MYIKRLTSIALGHFSIDVLNSSIAVILTVLSGKFDLSISQIGLAAMIYTFAASLTQPLFGMLADYLKGRWLAAISVAWTGTFYALAAFAPSYPLLVATLTVGALGSGAFHPVGMVNAASAGGKYPTTATSIFFLLGQSGLALGPMSAGLLLQYLDIAVGLPLLALTVIPAVVMMAMYLRHPQTIASQETEAPTQDSASVHSVKISSSAQQNAPEGALRAVRVPRRSTIVFVAFVAVVALRAATVQSLTTLLPKYFSDLGYTSGAYGVMIGIFAFAGALGTFLGGYLGDRVNRRLTIFASTLLSVPFAFLLLRVEGPLFYVVAAAAGALLNVPHSILIIMAQRLLPKREGMIGGAVLGFMFASGAAMAWFASWLADIVGLPLVLSVITFLPIGAAVSALVLPSTRRPVTTYQSAPAAAD
ncbi:MAG TPA: MFS transporter [Caldilineaceae bacterium]|nr:MFS transporter [Caldilineaceae bacterium]